MCHRPKLKGGTLAVSLAILVAGAPNARAQGTAPSPATSATPRPTSPARDTPLETEWYGYQTALSDVASVGLMFGAVATWRLCLSLGSGNGGRCDNSTSDAFGWAASGVYLLGAPTIHAVHGHWDKAGLSLGIRTLPFVVGLALAPGRGGGSSNAAAYTLFGGALAAMIIDDVLIAREEVQPQASTWYLAPAIDVKNHAANVAFVGSF
jgi:hypothetical protein